MYKPGLYPNFDELVKINNQLFSKINNYNIRENKDIPFIERKLEILNQLNTLDEEILLSIIASILCLQPFYDGNSRTLKIYMKKYLTQFKKELDLAENDKIIPIFYTPEEKCSSSDLKKIRFKNN